MSTFSARFTSKLVMTVSLVLLTLTMGLSSAQAEKGRTTSILYVCGIDFKAQGESVYLGVGFTSLHGRGKLSCYDILTGVTQVIPLKVTIQGPGAGFGVTSVVVSGGVSGIGISRGPESLLGKYGAVRAGAAVLVGGGATTALRISKSSVVLDLSLQFAKGVGVGADILSVNFEADNGRKTTEAKEETKEEVKETKPAVKEEPKAAKEAFVTEPPVATAAKEEPLLSENETVSAQVIYVDDSQPVQILDAQGRVVKVIYLKRAH